MKLLITGGFGFLGGRLAQYLAAQPGNQIVLGTRAHTAPPAWLPQAAVAALRWEAPDALDEICDGMDAIIHLAGMNAQECAADPAAAQEFNAGATERLLRAAARKKVKRFVYLSTAHVYGSPLVGTISEENQPVPRHPYAASHYAAEEFVLAAHRTRKIDGIVIRLSNAYGAPAHKDANCWMLLINDLCRQAVTTRSMALKSSGLQRRDFIPLSDVCRAVDHLLHLAAQDLRGGLFNVGGEWSPTVWQVACLVQERCEAILGYRPALTRLPPQPGDSDAALEYRIDALRQSGFRPGSDRVDEIDRLLAFCAASFH